MVSYDEVGVSFSRANKILDYLSGKIDTKNFFSSLDLPNNHILLTSMDGVGTKAHLLEKTKNYTTIAQDLFAANANDILTAGVKLSFFLDYVSSNYLDDVKIISFLDSLIKLCEQYSCKLLGGELAEQPDTYCGNFAEFVGMAGAVALKSKLIYPSVKEGDIVIGFESKGFHANGYTLLRYVLFKQNNLSLDSLWPDNSHKTIGEVLLNPTKIYIDTILKLRKIIEPKALVNITGGGIIDNLNRVLPNGLGGKLKLKVPQEYKSIAKMGNISNSELTRVFNLGIGYIAVIDARDIEVLKSEFSEPFTILGVITKETLGIKLV